MACEFIMQLSKLRKSSAESVENTNAFNHFKISIGTSDVQYLNDYVSWTTPMLLDEYEDIPEDVTGDAGEISSNITYMPVREVKIDSVNKVAEEPVQYGTDNKQTESEDSKKTEEAVEPRDTIVESKEGMQVLFGTDITNGESLYWCPNDTEQIFHANTGIIGTMGTGKTQFTKSMITQLYQKRKDNFESDDIGILIFDYKGDYNESKEDFIRATDAKVLKPYHLPFNPLSLTKREIQRIR